MLTVLTAGAARQINITGVLICIGIGLVIGLITVLVMKAQLKSVRPKHTAGDYVVPGSFRLHRSRDIFLYRHVHRTPKPKNNKN